MTPLLTIAQYRARSTRKKKRAHPEQDLQMAVAGFLRAVLRPPTLWTAFPSGGGGRVRGALLKGMGLHPGWPDMIVAHRFFCLGEIDLDFTFVVGIELKAKRGSQSPEQKAVEASFIRLGWGYEVCRSVEDVKLALAHAGIPMRIPGGA